MGFKYCYVKKINTKNHSQEPDYSIQDLFLGIRAGCLIMIVFFLGYFFVTEPYNKIIHTPLGSTYAQESQINNNILGEAVVLSPSPTPTIPIIKITPTPTQTPTINLSKNSYSIAVFGDSMVDTMGERLEYLEHALKNKYPRTQFTLYNFGQGAQNVSDGLSRLNNQFDYQDRHYPSLNEIKPDIIIIGSFAYNPFSPHDRDRYWSTLTQLIEQVKAISPQVYILAEIAPLKSGFGKGPNGVNWDESTAYQHATNIIDLLEGAINVSRSLNIPLINAFNPSQASSDKSGYPKYVNSSDGIHPSVAGHEFMAEKIAITMNLK